MVILHVLLLKCREEVVVMVYVTKGSRWTLHLEGWVCARCYGCSGLEICSRFAMPVSLLYVSFCCDNIVSFIHLYLLYLCSSVTKVE